MICMPVPLSIYSPIRLVLGLSWHLWDWWSYAKNTIYFRSHTVRVIDTPTCWLLGARSIRCPSIICTCIVLWQRSCGKLFPHRLPLQDLCLVHIRRCAELALSGATLGSEDQRSRWLHQNGSDILPQHYVQIKSIDCYCISGMYCKALQCQLAVCYLE